MIEFVLPQTTGEWLAWLVAFGCVLTGLLLLLAPRLVMRVVGLGESTSNPGGVSEIRSILGGLFLGIGFACIMFAQPLVYAALGFGFVCAVIGRLISFVADRAFTGTVIAATVIEGFGAFFPLAYAFGVIV